MPAVAGTHAPGRGEGVEGLRGWLRDIITAVSCRRGSKSQRKCKVWWKRCSPCSIKNGNGSGFPSEPIPPPTVPPPRIGGERR